MGQLTESGGSQQTTIMLTGIDCLVGQGVDQRTLAHALTACFGVAPDSVIADHQIEDHIDTLICSPIWACWQPMSAASPWAFRLAIDGTDECEWPQWQQRMAAFSRRLDVPVWYNDETKPFSDAMWVVAPNGHLSPDSIDCDGLT